MGRKCKSVLSRDVERIVLLGEAYGWRLKARDKAPMTLEFEKPDRDLKPMKMMVFYSTGKVATTVNHPKQGRNQLYRHNVGWGLLARLFKKPRLHTRNGYRRR